MNVFEDVYRERNANLLARAYSKAAVEKAADFLGLSPVEAVQYRKTNKYSEIHFHNLSFLIQFIFFIIAKIYIRRLVFCFKSGLASLDSRCGESVCNAAKNNHRTTADCREFATHHNARQPSPLCR